jgi:hypothetical protein
MEQQNVFWIQFTLMLFAMVGIVQLGFALRAFIVEQREGLPSSFKRVIVLSITSTMLIIIAFAAITTDGIFTDSHLNPTGGEILPDPGKNERTLKIWNKFNEIKQGIEHLDKAVEQLKTEIEAAKSKKELSIKNEIPNLSGPVNQFKITLGKIENELDIPKNISINTSNEKVPVKKIMKEALPKWLLPLAVLLMLIGTACFFLMGDSRNLVNKEWLEPFKRPEKAQIKARKSTLEQLNRLAGLIDKDQFEDGLNLADKIDSRKLTRLDRLDFYYLKSFCVVKILMADYLEDSKGSAPLPSEQREFLLSGGIKELGEVLERAPRMAESQYLMGIVLIIKEEYSKALEMFKLAQKRLSGQEECFKYFKSFCLLKLADDLLSKADREGADKLFEEVVSLEVSKDQIPGVLVQNRLLNVKESYNERKLDDARKGLASIAQIEGLSQGQKKKIGIIRETMEIMFLYTETKINETLKNTGAFLQRCCPPGLPEPDDQTADEFMFRVINEDDLPFPAAIFRAFYFLQALVMLNIKEKRGKSLSKDETEELAFPLLRALQFEPRNRDALACLGALYFWFLPQKKEKALEWLEASDNMGVESDYIHDLLEKYRSIETERKYILERFMTLSSRYLADGSVNAAIKQALAKELGQFHEFRPILIELGDLDEIQQKSPTIQSLLNRAHYLFQFSKDISQSEAIAEKKQILSIAPEYSRLVEVIKSASIQLEALEMRIMEEIARQVLQ